MDATQAALRHELPRNDVPFVVDLDGTLIHSDLLWESLLLFVRQHFPQLWRLPLWLLGGKAHFKHRLAAAIDFDAAALPYDRSLLAYLAELRAAGTRTIVLATGSQRRLADMVAAHLGLFDVVLATDDDGVNLTGKRKAAALVARYGEQGFDYLGNDHVDLPVWRSSRHALSVTATPYALGDGRVTRQLGDVRRNWAGPLVKALRPRQWLKNLLVFVPLAAGHAFSATTLTAALVALLAFSLCASSAYLLNDALDAQDDRNHPRKRFRPLAAGTLPIGVALAVSVLFALAALALCAAFDPLLLAAVGVYFVTTLTYSLYLKRLLMVDVVTLALLYSLRILGGAAASHVTPSFWLLTFSFFIFLSLALLKRHSELVNLQQAGQLQTRGRGYSTADALPVAIMGINSAFMSVLIFMLYFNSQNVLMLYRQPAWLLGIVPLLVFWLGRLWTLSFRGQINDDPVLYVSKDPASLCVIALCAALTVAATITP